MKNISFFFVGLFVAILSLATMAQNWKVQNSGLPSSLNPTLIFSAVDSNICWGVQTYEADYTLNPKYVLTTNGGNNWSLSDVQIPSGLGVWSIFAIDAVTAWIAVDDPNNGTNSGIYKTTNAGTNWFRQGSVYSGGGHPRIIYFFDSNEGICIGNVRNNDFQICTTVDGGTNWIQVPGSNIPPPAAPDDRTFHSTSESAGNYFWFGTVSRSVFKSTDRGDTWTVVRDIPATGGFAVDIAFEDTLNGIAQGHFGDRINRVKETHDGGVNWINLPTAPQQPSFYFLSHVSGLDSTYIITSHGNINHPTSTVPGSIFTTDRGQTWVQFDNVPHGPSSFSPDGVGWSGGLGNIIYKITKDAFPVSSNIFIDPYFVDFGDVIIGNSSDSKSILITNSGLQSFTLNSVSTNSPSYVLANLPSFPKEVLPGDWLIFDVSFIPTNHGPESSEITISTDTNSDINLFLIGNGILFGNQFHTFYDRVNNALVSERTAIVDSFLNANPVIPFIEQDSICQFIYRGNATSISIPGEVNEWDTYSSPMEVLSTTNLWYRSEVFEPDARLEYKFFKDGTLWIADPLNPRIVGEYGNSELRMPDYIQPPELLYYPNIPHGTLHDTTFFSTNLGNSRSIRVYLPPGYSLSNNSYPVVVFHDGIGFIELALANNVLDYLISQNRIQPLIGVFVPPVNRDEEYVGQLQNQFAAFIAEELMPYIDVRYRTMINPDKRATVGISNGGNIALWIAYNYPNIFGSIGSYSGHIQYPTSSVFESGIQHSLKIYLDAGTYDLSGFLEITQNFRDVIQAKGYDFRYNEWHEGHSWLNWGAHLDNALEFFFPSIVEVQNEKIMPNFFTLMQNYPNPFNPSTTISYSIPISGFVTLKVHDVLGNEVATLVNEEKPTGSYEVEFDASKLSSGMYLYTFKAGSFTQTKKLILLK